MIANNDDVMIQFDSVTRTFGDTRAVDQVSFHVRTGEVFGFIGPNGAGKTTSMRILSTLDVPTSGEAWIDGFSVVDDPDLVRQRLGWMPDGFGTYPNVNCAEYLDFFARSYGLRGKDRRRALVNVMGFTQLDQLANKPVTSLSKGMKQRLCLGRALIHNPKVLILDEPAAGLDPRARIELREMIGALAEEGKALLVSSHILTELAEMCDRVGIIEHGRLLAVGTVEEILNQQRHGDSDEPEKIKIELVVLSDIQFAKQWLESNDGVVVDRVAQKTLQVVMSGDTEAQADLLTKMIGAGIRVLSYSGKQKSLEDVFLTVTRGKVQ
ncbi:MAG: ABC transporter ATP-binding protein [Mariniblastus sp.]|nr:ABC transporter ATP-binding protein [Mariniblastus sp.]